MDEKTAKELRRISLLLADAAKRLERLARAIPPIGTGTSGQLDQVTVRKFPEISRANLMRGALLSLGGRATYVDWTRTATRMGQVTSKLVSSVPAKLEKQGEVIRVGFVSGSPTYQVTDPLRWIGVLRRDQNAYAAMKEGLRDRPTAVEQFTRQIILREVSSSRTFLISGFLQAITNVGDTDLREMIGTSLATVLSELAAKDAIELTEGLGGILIGNKPVARVSMKEGAFWQRDQQMSWK